jgi:hypothetical protein
LRGHRLEVKIVHLLDVDVVEAWASHHIMVALPLCKYVRTIAIPMALQQPSSCLASSLWKDVCTQQDIQHLAFCGSTLDVSVRVEVQAPPVLAGYHPTIESPGFI